MRSGVLSLAVCACSAHAALVTIEVADRSLILDGKPFGTAGAYEMVRGRAKFAVDPQLRQNAGITDIHLAPRNADGLVEFSADIYLLKPRDPGKGNGTLLLEVPNRGGKGMLSVFHRARSSADPRSEAEFGDGLLFEQGYTLVWAGWQHDVPRREQVMRLYAPEAKGAGGLVRSEYTANPGTTRFSLGDSGHVPYPADLTKPASITVREGIHGGRLRLAPELWTIENGVEVALRKPATPGSIYEVIYHSSDPAVAGLGLAALRDTVAFLRRGGNADSPLSEQHRFLKRAIGFGTSQSAMVLKALLYHGFNEDEQGRPVFDGIFANVAGGRRSAFPRFAQPSRTAGPMRGASFSATDQFPFADAEARNPATGLADGLLKQAAGRHVVPKIFYTNSTYEYWGSAGSLIHTTPDGKRDIEPPPTTRIYVMAGGQHGPAAFPPRQDRSEHPANWNDYRWTLRALLGRMDAWIRGEQEPPASRIPAIAAGTLVPVSEYAFPAIPGVRRPSHTHGTQQLDFGPEFFSRGIAAKEPPELGMRFVPLVPQCDADGIDLAGVKMPAVAVPLGTFTGWNLRTPPIGAPEELLGNAGSFLRFALRKEDRQASGDPRLSVEERYGGAGNYLARLEQSAKGLAAEGFLLPGDVAAIVRAGQREWDWVHAAGRPSETAAR